MGMKKQDDLTGGALTDLPNEKYQKFFAKFKEHKTTIVSLWRPIDILAYFCQQYQIAFQTQYGFKYNTPLPSKCFEVFQIKKLAQVLSSQPQILKDYIDWIFTIKVPQNKKRFTSISFLTKEENTKEYKWKVLSNNQITRNTSLPSSVLFEINKIEEVKDYLTTYGSIAFFIKATDHPSYQSVMQILQQHNITIELLEKIK